MIKWSVSLLEARTVRATEIERVSILISTQTIPLVTTGENNSYNTNTRSYVFIIDGLYPAGT